MKKSLVLSLLAAAFVSSAHATVVYDNVTTNAVYGYSSGTSVGQSFVTGNTALNFTDFLFPQLTGGSNAYTDAYTAGETMNLYANNPANNTPVTTVSLATFSLTNVNGGSANGQTSATPNATTILTANTRYWLVLAAPNAASTVYWNYPNYTGYTANSALGVTLPADNTAFESTGATTTYFALTDGPQLIYLEATAVPEPSTYALLALGGIGALFLVRRARTVRAV